MWIQHEGRRAFVGDPTVVSFYNRDDRYARRAICPDGDRADWFAVSPALAVDAVTAYDPSVEAHPDRPFPFDHGPASPTAYLTQRAVFDAAARRTSEPLAVDEAVVSLLDGVLAGAFRARAAASPRPAAGSRDVIEQARALLAADVSARWELGPLARRLGTSPFTLCRRFHAETSMTLTEYRMQLRLRTSLEPVAAGEPLTDVALALGFSSHSHFTACFRRGFGAPPSAVRGQPASRWPRAPDRQGTRRCLTPRHRRRLARRWRQRGCERRVCTCSNGTRRSLMPNVSATSACTAGSRTRIRCCTWSFEDPWFAWLRPISALIVQADERMADDAPVQMTEARDLGREVRRLLDGDGSAAPFRDAYHRLLQDSPDVVLAHGRLLAHLNEPRS